MVEPPGTQLSHVSSAAKFVEVLDLFCNIEVPATYLKATEVNGSDVLLGFGTARFVCQYVFIDTVCWHIEMPRQWSEQQSSSQLVSCLLMRTECHALLHAVETARQLRG